MSALADCSECSCTDARVSGDAAVGPASSHVQPPSLGDARTAGIWHSSARSTACIMERRLERM